MIVASKQIVRIVLLVMLFQFVGPSFLPITTQREAVSKETTIGIQHTSIVVPVLLKDKDETENTETTSHPVLALLIDLSSHVINLSAAHDNKHSIHEKQGITHPPRFRVFCTLLI
jgi:hypothetical protein